eukprot:366330-Chlamydomonas_euryale.AAC.3
MPRCLPSGHGRCPPPANCDSSNGCSGRVTNDCCCPSRRLLAAVEGSAWNSKDSHRLRSLKPSEGRAESTALPNT